MLVVFITIHIKWYKLNYQINFVLEESCINALK